MKKLYEGQDFVVLVFESSVEKELTKTHLSTLSGVREIKDKVGGRVLKVYLEPGSLGEKLLKGEDGKHRTKLEPEDFHFYINLLLKNPLLKLCLSISLLGIKVGLLSFLICGNLVFPLIKNISK